MVNNMNPFWVYAIPDSFILEVMPLAKNVGKWCIFVHCDDLSLFWINVRSATRAGLFWKGSKVSTDYGRKIFSLNNPKANPDEHVICVYTYDYQDAADVMRVRDALYGIGIDQPLGYKTDDDTASGIDRWAYADSGWMR